MRYIKGRCKGMASFLLSVIIPTRNRQFYAERAIEQVLSVANERLQLVIQDNSDEPLLRSFCDRFAGDPRLTYQYTAQLLSFVDNFSEAVSLADGEFICMIGDDDGIMPEIVTVAAWAKEHDVDAVTQVTNAVYLWPAPESVLGYDNSSGTLRLSYPGTDAKQCKVRQAVEQWMSYGGQKYLATEMVKLYHGLVKKKCLETVKQKTGHYFGGLSPDIYAAVALSLTVEKAVRIRYPITISGVCPGSGSADSITGKHTGELKEAPHLKGHADYTWSAAVPAFYSVETIWADSGLQAINELGMEEYMPLFNRAALTMYCLHKSPSYKRTIKQYARKHRITWFAVFRQTIRLRYRDFIRRLIKRLTRKTNDVSVIYDINDIVSAQKEVQNLLRRNGISMEEVIKNMTDVLGEGCSVY